VTIATRKMPLDNNTNYFRSEVFSLAAKTNCEARAVAAAPPAPPLPSGMLFMDALRLKICPSDCPQK